MRLAVLALMLLAPLAAPALAEPPSPIHYSVSDRKQDPVDGDFHYTEWPAGARLCALPEQRWVKVVEVGPRTTIEDKHNRGYVVAPVEGAPDAAAPVPRFGGSLTPFCFAVDFDGDGTPDPVSVSFSADFQIVVSAAKGELRLRPHGGAYMSWKGGNATAEIVPAPVAGTTLLKVGSSVEACADYGDYYVTITAGVPKLALAVDGLADPPVHVTPVVRFDAKRRTATVTVTTSNEEEKPRRKLTRYRLVDGVYREPSARPR